MSEETIDQLAEVNRQIAESFRDFSPTSLPDDRFRAALAALVALNDEDAADSFASVLGMLNSKRNMHFLNLVTAASDAFLKRWLFFLLDELNTTLEIYLATDNMKRAFRILEIVASYADARTLSILEVYIEDCRDTRVRRALEEYRDRAQERIDLCLKRIEFMDVDPIVTHFEEWQE